MFIFIAAMLAIASFALVTEARLKNNQLEKRIVLLEQEALKNK